MPDRKQKITPRALLELKIPHSPHVSPDGARVVFAVSEADFEESRWVSRLWLADVAEGKSRRITHSYEGERFPRWSPDGKSIAFLSSRPDMTEPPPEQEDEEEMHREQIWIIPADSGEAVRLTNVREGVRSFQWHPESKTIVFLMPEARPQPFQHVRDDSRKRKLDPVVELEDRHRVQFWEVGLEERKPELLYTGDFGIAEFDLSPDGNRIVFNTNYSGEPNDYHRFDLFILDIEAGESIKLLEQPGGKFQPQWSPDGDSIAFVANLDPSLSYSQECVWQIAASGGEAKNLFAGLGYDAIHMLWSHHAKQLYANAADRMNTPLLTFDNGGFKSLIDSSDACLEFDAATDGFIAAVLESSIAAPELFAIESDGKPRPLSELNIGFTERYDLPKQEVIRWISSDGMEIEGLLVYPQEAGGATQEAGSRSQEAGSETQEARTGPPDQGTETESLIEIEKKRVSNPTTPYPLVIQVHGGPKGRATNSLRSYYMHPVWAAEGYLVLQPNFRGSEGYGNEFAISNRRDLGGGDYRDIIAGVDYLVESDQVDPARIGIMGGSYGGYMVNWAIGQTDRFAAGISQFGIFSLVTDYSNSELSRWDPEYMGAFYWEDPEIYRQCSPATYLENIKTPVLIMHGQGDGNTFISNSKEMYRALRERDVTVEFVHYPREGHGLREPNHRMDEIRRCLAWFDKYLKGAGAAQPVYRIGDKIEHEGYELQVLRAEDAEYAGWHEEWGRLLEVSFSLASKDPVDEAWRFELDEAVLVQDGRDACPLKGVPVDIGGGRNLVAGEKLGLDLHPDKDTGRLSVGIAVTYQIPERGGDFELRVSDFPPVAIAIGPKPEKPPHEPEAGVEAESTLEPEGPVQVPQRSVRLKPAANRVRG